MSADLTFRGELTFGSPRLLHEAINRAVALLREDDDDLQRYFDDDALLQAHDHILRVNIDLSGPSHWWFSLESFVEELSETAAAGYVDGTHEAADGKIRYHAGGRQEEIDASSTGEGR